MNLPDETLRAWIETNWALVDVGITDDDVSFSLTPVNIASPFDPQITVQLAGFQRLQDAEDSLYRFTFSVEAALWNKTYNKSDLAQALHWKMVEHIKSFFDTASAIALPSGWRWAHVETAVNTGMAMDALPNCNLFNMTITALIAWS